MPETNPIPSPPPDIHCVTIQSAATPTTTSTTDSVHPTRPKQSAESNADTFHMMDSSHQTALPYHSPPPATPSSPLTLATNPNQLRLSMNRKRRIRFTNAWDILLLKSVTAVDAHFAPHGESQSRFEEALAIFLPALPTGKRETVVTPTWKTLNDRFKKFLADHRDAVRNNGNTSGIIEVRGEREVLLDDIALSVDEWEEKKRTERDERTELDRRLLHAGQEILTRALVETLQANTMSKKIMIRKTHLHLRENKKGGIRTETQMMRTTTG